MKYLALWAGVTAGVLLVVGLGALAIIGIIWVASQPSLWWIPLAFLFAGLVATLVTAYDYLTEKRPPKKGPPQ
jgi:CHASE2 domain-containing sensor protein